MWDFGKFLYNACILIVLKKYSIANSDYKSGAQLFEIMYIIL